ncbi:MAG: RNA polymerase factor sigma-54 [Gammaproteobacteria bacterium]|nr:RNA polymerase factor sigma-54 [Gammaproteobacteria bacterium]
MVKLSLQLKISQQLTMTPQLQQAIQLLQLPVMDLQAKIREALEENIMLETGEDPGSTTAEPEETTQTAPPEPVSPDVAVGEWRDENYVGPASSNWNSDDFLPTPEIADRSQETLGDHLLWQLGLEPLSDEHQAIGRTIIDAIGDDGYMIETLAEIRQTLLPEITAEEEELEKVLHLIQRFDPAGVGARTIEECLRLQLDQFRPDTPGLELARRLVAEYLDLVASLDFARLRQMLRVSEDLLEDALTAVRACQPKPGYAVQNTIPEYIIPDVFVRKQDNIWLVDANSAVSPKLRVNQTYASLLRGGKDHDALKGQLQEARWLVRSLEIRNETLLKVATSIIERQTAFLEHGEEHMQPLILKDIAQAVEMHESTISRVTTNKYMHTPRGIFEFRYFFSSHLSVDDGGQKSAVSVRAKIKKLLASEDRKKPLSDNKIAQVLSEDGINVARRTVTKYREAMNIPSSSERRRMASR